MSFPFFRRLLLSALGLFACCPSLLLAQRQMEPLGRGLVAVRPNSTEVYVGWRLLGDDPAGTGFNLYRSIGGAPAVKLNASPLTASTNYRDTPPSSAFSSVTTYQVVPVLDGIEQAPGAPVTLSAAAGQQFLSIPLATTHPNPDSTYPYSVKFCWVGDFDGDGEYDFLIDRLSTNPDATERQYLEAYTRHGTFLWRMDMGPNSLNQYAYEPGSSAISIGDTDNVTVYDLDGDGRAEVAVRTANGVTVTNAAGQLVTNIVAGNNTSQFVSIIDGLSGVERARAPLPNPWAQHGTLTNKCAIAYLDGVRPSVVFYGYNREDGGAFRRVFSSFDFRAGQLTQRWSTAQTFAGAEGHQIRIADVDNDGKDEIVEIGHVIDHDGTQLFVIPEVSHGDRFHVADIDPDRPGLETYIIQQYNPSFLATAYYDAGTGDMLKKWYATTTVDVGRGLAQDMTAAHKGYELVSTQAGIFNAKGEQIYANSFFPYEGLWWDADLLREFIAAADGNGFNPVINKFNAATGGMDRLWSIYTDFGSFINRTAFGGRPAFWGDILGDWREELIFVTSDHASIRIYTPTSTATNRLYTLMHNPAYRMQATTKGYVQASNVDYYLGAGMTPPPPPPMVRAELVWSGGANGSVWDQGNTASWRDAANASASQFTNGTSVRFDLTGAAAAPVVLSGDLRPSELTVYSPHDYTLSGAGSLAGAMPLVKAGRGALTLTGAHSYTGATTVWDGALRVDGTLTASSVTIWGGTWGGALAKGLSGGRLAGSGSITQPVTLGYRGALTPGAGMGAPGTLTLGSHLTAQDGAVLAFDLSADPSGQGQANDRLVIGGNLVLSGTVHLHVNALTGALVPGTYTLLTYAGTLSGTLANLKITLPEGTAHTLALGSGSLTLTVPVTRAPASVTWSGAVSGAWDIANSNNWSLLGTATPFVSGDTVTFDALGAARPSITLQTNATVGGLTFAGPTNYTLSGSGAISGTGGLTKTGSGTVTLSTVNTFTGPATLAGGVLVVNALADGGQPSPLGAATTAAADWVFDGGTLRLSGSQTNTNRSLTLATGGGTFDLPSATLQLSGNITGPGTLTKSGAGTLILANANTHSGGTVLQAGTLVLASDTANSSGLGSGGITLQGGTLRMFNNTSSYNTSSWSLHVPAGATARFEADGRSDLNTPLTGSGTLNFYTPFVRTNLNGNLSAFTGRLNVVSDSDGGDLRLGNSAGLPNAWLDLGVFVTVYSRAGSGTTTFNIGALSGVISSVLNAGTGSGEGANQPAHWRVGGLNLDSTFEGRFTGTSQLTKVGTGTLTLTGASTHTGTTTVAAGNLLLAGGSFNGSHVTVQSGAGFGGGNLTGNLTLASGARVLFGPDASTLNITGNLSLGGTVVIALRPGQTMRTGVYFPLQYSGTLTGTPSFVLDVPGYTASFDTSLPGLIGMTVREAVTPPTDLRITPSSGGATLAWSASPEAASYTILRAASIDGPYTPVATGVTAQAFNDTGLTNGTTYFYRVQAVTAQFLTKDSNPSSVSVGGSSPHALWRFDEAGGNQAVSDVSAWHGTLVNSPSRSAGRINQGLNLNATAAQHVTLPTGITSELRDFTLTLWVRLSSQDTWARLVDFGSGTNNYLFLATRTSTANRPRFALRTPTTPEQFIDSTVALPTGTWTHIAVTLSGSTGTLYLNGTPVGVNNALSLQPASLGATTANYFGRSQFTADPYLNGSIDEVSLYGRALTQTEITALLSPPSAPAWLTATPGVGQIALSWPPVSGSDSYTVLRFDGGFNYQVLVDQLTTPTYTVTNLPAGLAQTFVVRSRRLLTDSPWSSSATAVPLPVLTALETWRETHFGTTSPVDHAADSSDPDGDGLVNLLEYALGGHPLTPSPNRLPSLALTLGLPPSLVLTFDRIADPALVYQVQATDSLNGPWQSIWTSTGSENTPGPVQVPDSTPLAPPARRFLRLQVSTPAP